MKFLTKQIKTKKDIKNYIDNLVKNNMLYHFEDYSRDIPAFESRLTQEQLDLLDLRSDEMLNVDYDYTFDYACEILEID
jgi:hypothetical protein